MRPVISCGLRAVVENKKLLREIKDNPRALVDIKYHPLCLILRYGNLK